MYQDDAARARFLELGCTYGEAADEHDQEDGTPADHDDHTDDEDDRTIHGWLRASVDSVGPGSGEYTVDLWDDLGMPGSGTHWGTLSFSLPPAVAADSPRDHEARVIKAATEELAEHGCVPDSPFHGSGDSFSVQVRGCDRAREWVEVRRPVAERLELLLAGLRGLLDDLAADWTAPGLPRIDTDPEPRPGRPDTNPEDAAGPPIVDRDDREAFLRVVAARQPDRVLVTRHQGGWTGCLGGAEGLRHPALRGLRSLRAEAARREGELSGFTAVFRSGDETYRHRVEADWVEELDRDLEDWQETVRAVREEQTSFPHLKSWAKRLYRALLDDERFLAADTPSAQHGRGVDLARSLFGPDCPVDSVYIQRALGTARTERAALLLERQCAEWRTEIPAWAARLAASADFRAGTTAERAMRASNFLHAHDPAADTSELVQLLHTAAAALLT